MPVPLEWLPVCFNAQALAALFLGIVFLAKDFGFGGKQQALAVGLLVLGLSPFGWARVIWFQQNNPDLSWAWIRSHGSSGLFPLISYGEPRLAAFLTKASISNALPMSLATGIWALMAGTRFSNRKRIPWVSGALVFGTLMLHLATGILVAAGMLLRECYLIPAEPATRRRGILLAIFVLGALAAAAPYAWSIVSVRTGGATGELGSSFGRAVSLQSALALFWLGLFAAFSLWREPLQRKAFLLLGVPALLVTISVSMIDGNEYKGVFVLAVCLCLPAAQGLSRLLGGRPVLFVLAALLLAPNTWLTARTYMEETPPGIPSESLQAAMVETGARLPADAVVWQIEPGEGYSPFTYGLGRPSFISDAYALRIMGQWTSEAGRTRRALLEGARSGRLLESLREAEALVAGRPLAILITREDVSQYPFLIPSLKNSNWTPVVSHPSFALYVPK